MQRIFSEIAEERAVHQTLGFDSGHDAELTGAHWVALITRHAGLAVASQCAEVDDLDRFRRQMVRVAALAVAAIECLDLAEALRKGCEDPYPAGPTSEQRGPGY